MTAYILRRVVFLFPAWLLMSVLAFILMRIIPGDPAAMMMGIDATPEATEQVRARLGLDLPLYVQFFVWLGRALRGDLGESYFLGQPVFLAMTGRLPVTLSLTALAFAVAVSIGLPAGVMAARHRNTWIDTLMMSVALLGLSVPDFAMGLVLIFVFSVALELLPTGGYVPVSEGIGAWLTHLLLPAVSLGFIQAALIARIARSSMLEVMGMDFIRTARAKGLLERVVVYRHALRNALIPVITVLGTVAAIMLGGAFIIETVFNLPGVGDLVVMAVRRRDYPLVQGGILLIATVVIVVNLLVDLLYVVADRRIRYT